ncbi:MAG: ABC transporter ATP-binding protein [Alphaproteobacteria bacterium]|nr:ABC transporter ATP-binding protein [Alphaproteobacteria bacterium]
MPQESVSKPITVLVHGARIDYGGSALFDNLDFTLSGGRWTSILGPSGVGKTTLLRLIAGLTDFDSEQAVTCDDGRPLHGRVAYMAQQDLLLPWLTAIQNILLGPSLRGQRSAPSRERARNLLEQVGLSHKGDALPAELSGGQRQRIALARTLLEDRPVVLMDEPFSSLDALTRLRLQDIAARLLRGRTVLLVTHDPLEALRLSDEIQIMSGEPATITDAPIPPGMPPRAVDDRDIVARHVALLRQLQSEAKKAA